jgi:hypothetical protein
MLLQIIPLQAVPNQTVNVSLGKQACSLHVYQKAFGLFMDVYANGSLIIGGVICENANRIVRDAYLGFVGDLAFWDLQGASDPDYTGLGGRFLLFYNGPGSA